jgi:hypothetical protein
VAGSAVADVSADVLDVLPVPATAALVVAAGSAPESRLAAIAKMPATTAASTPPMAVITAMRTPAPPSALKKPLPVF